jgi:hypothetical protein
MNGPLIDQYLAQARMISESGYLTWLTQPDRLIRLRLEEARRAKWEAGRLVHGNDSFVGNPVEELFGELVDGLNYTVVAREFGYRMADIEDRLVVLAEEVQRIPRERALRAGG